MIKRKYKRKKPFYKKRWFSDFILFLLFFLSLSWLLFKTPYFEIKKIEFRGKTDFSSRIREFVEKDKNFFLLNSSGLAFAIKSSFPEFEDVEVIKKFPDTVLIKIEEKKAIGNFCPSSTFDNCFLLAEDGTIFKKKEKGKDLPKFSVSEEKEFKIGDAVVEEKLINNFIFLRDELLKSKIFIEKVEISPFELKIKTKNGFDIYFSREINFKIQIDSLLAVLRKKISQQEQKNLKYIDLRGVKEEKRGQIYWK